HYHHGQLEKTNQWWLWSVVVACSAFRNAANGTVQTAHHRARQLYIVCLCARCRQRRHANALHHQQRNNQRCHHPHAHTHRRTNQRRMGFTRHLHITKRKHHNNNCHHRQRQWLCYRRCNIVCACEEVICHSEHSEESDIF